MKLTNELHLPDPIVAAIANDGYSKGDCDYSTTQLIKPARIVALQRQHGSNIIEDASDRIFSLIGQSIHTILERAANQRYVVERRYFATVNGFKIGGQIDVFDVEDGMLSDYKLTSRYSAADGVKPEWQAQASINRFLMERNGQYVNGAQIVCIFRDWSKMAASREREYPPRQVVVLKVPLWSLAVTEEYIAHRIEAHEAAKIELPFCTDDEKWAKPHRYALMQKGRKRAIKLYDTLEEAQTAVTDRQFVEDRPGEWTRCEHYCSVAPFCSVFREYMEAKQ